MDFALLGGAVFAIALGAQLVPWRTSRSIALIALVASGFLIFGFLAIFSIGLPFLPAGVVLLLMLYRRLGHTPATVARARAALGGAAIGFAVPLLYIALILPATVECFPNGAGTSSQRWGRGQAYSSTGAISGGAGGSSGRIESAESIATFRCEQGRLVEFQREAR
jgi:uncharacterized membrane protein YgcG